MNAEMKKMYVYYFWTTKDVENSGETLRLLKMHDKSQKYLQIIESYLVR